MILDVIENASCYQEVLSGLVPALEAAAKYRRDAFMTGRADVDGDKLFLIGSQYDTKPLTGDSVMEAHRKYADVMYMVEGEEIIYVKSTKWLGDLTMDYDAEKDCLFGKLDENTTAVHLRTGQFIVLLPQDAHCPGCCIEGNSRSVKKVICKVML